MTMSLRRHPLRAALALLAPVAAEPQNATADLIVTNARIYTVDASRPFVEAMVVANGRVLFTGPARAAMTYRTSSTRVIDAQGQTVVPGMIDAHVHLLGLGTALRTVDLVGTTSYDQVVARVAARARELPSGTWITGRGWDQNDWGDTRFPTHDALSRAVPNHPVYLTRVDGHAALANATAIKAAGLTAATQDPSGGRIERGADNEPTGVLVDRAMGLVGRVIPPASKQEQRAATLAAIRETNRWGLTGVHDAGVARGVIDVFEELAKEGQYSLRNYVMVANDDAAIDHYLARGPQSGLYDGRLWIKAIKISADGALGSRGAALIEPYSDDAANRGLLLVPEGRVKSVAVKALPKGFQVNVHAIGDRGNRVVLDEMEAALREVPVSDHRFRIEHAQIVHSGDIARFATLGVIPSMQASHQTSDMYWAGNRIGPVRLLGAYAWRSLLNTGVIIPNGSDFPVEHVNPLISFHAAVARQDANDWPAGGWLPEQRMTREEALKSMTLWPAYAAFMEKEVGSLEPGKLADFVILDQDIMRVPNELILRTRVIATYLGGKPVYERGPAQ
ncbi:MAG: amidohydrolase [Gemmatimonadaceae bacterium]